MSRVDVVIPCYNYGRYLAHSVQSVLDQPDVDTRVLILDDCSSDGSESVGRRLADSDGRVEYRRHAVNRGHIATYNEGLLEWASGDYVLLLSADDALAPGALSRAARVFDTQPHVGLCYGRQQVISDDAPAASLPSTASSGCEILSGDEFVLASCRAGANLVPTPTAVVRTSLQQLVGGYRADLPHTADLDMWLRLAGRSGVARLDAVQAFKRMHGTNMQYQYVATQLPDLKQRLGAFEAALGGIDAGREPSALRCARTALAKEAFWAASAAFDRKEGPACTALLNWALGLDPSLATGRAYTRLAWKRRLGPLLWSVVSPLVQASRHVAGRPVHGLPARSAESARVVER